MTDVTPNDRIGGYAPGNYTCKCLFCGKEFVGDKRALSCFDCAKAHRDRVDGERLAIEQAAVAAARAETLKLVADWLRAGGWAECYANGPEPEDLAALIERGEPLRWAAEREGERA